MNQPLTTSQALNKALASAEQAQSLAQKMPIGMLELQQAIRLLAESNVTLIAELQACDSRKP